jgi:transglutaminase-like putative cysteine protease
MLYDLRHTTRYEYDYEVGVSHHLAHLRPRDLPRQRCLMFSLAVDPRPETATEHRDYHGNHALLFAVERNHRELTVTARSRVEVLSPALPPPASTPPWEQVAALCEGAGFTADTAAGEFRCASPLIPIRTEFAAFAESAFPVGRPILEAVLDMTGRIFTGFAFDPQATTTTTSLETLLKLRRGVCQDFAHLEVACLRSLGIPARYVSGYLETRPPAGQPRLIGADASHAWAAFWCPGYGWIDVDPTNNLLPGERHVTVAWGRDFSEVSPVRGVLVGSGRHSLTVAVDVCPVEPSSISSSEG